MKDLARRLYRDQRIRFLFVGGINTVVGYVIFAGLAHWVFADVPFGYLISVIISYAISITLAFVLYRRLVYKVRGRVVVDFLRFVSVYAFSIAINIALLPALVEIGGVPPLIAQVLVLVVTTALSYFGHGRFSFRRSEPSGQPDDEPDPPRGRPLP